MTQSIHFTTPDLLDAKPESIQDKLHSVSEEYCYGVLPCGETSLGVGTLNPACSPTHSPNGIEQLVLFFSLEEPIDHIMDIKVPGTSVSESCAIAVKNNTLYTIGTEGKPLENISCNLSPEAAKHYSLQYRVHKKGQSKNLFDLPWVTDGQVAGTTEESFPLDAIQIKLVKKNPFNTVYFKNACENKLAPKACFMLAANSNGDTGDAVTGDMSIPEPMNIEANQDMSDEDYKACSMILNVCQNMIQKTITDAAEQTGIKPAEAIKSMDSWVTAFCDFPFPFFNFESAQTQDYKNDEFSLSANADVIESIVNIDGVPALKKAVISALKSAGPKGNLASYSNTERNFNYFGIVTAYEKNDIAMRIVAFSMNMKETKVSALCGNTEKTHLDSHYTTYLFKADKEMMIKMQSKVEDKMLDTISKYLNDFIESFFGDELQKYKQKISQLISNVK